MNGLQDHRISPSVIFFLWGYLRGMVYGGGTQFASLKELKDKIVFEIQSIPATYFSSSFKSFEDRIKQCIEVRGQYFE